MLNDFDKAAKKIFGAFFLPLLIAFNCLCMQEYLRSVDKDLCKPAAAKTGFQFDVDSIAGEHRSWLFYSDIPCSSAAAQSFYEFLSFTMLLCFGLSALLPCIFLIRQRESEKIRNAHGVSVVVLSETRTE